jgi:hypothetical protein
MRVRLSYTAEVDEVLAEVALLLGSLAETFQSSNGLYGEIIADLENEEFNPNKFHENIDALRRNLGKIDIRCLEVGQVVTGLDGYQRQLREAALEPPSAPEAPSPTVEITESGAEDD